MKIKKKKRRLYNSDFKTLHSKRQLFDDSEGRYVHYGSRKQKKYPDRFSLKWENVTCPNCLAYHTK